MISKEHGNANATPLTSARIKNAGNAESIELIAMKKVDDTDVIRGKWHVIKFRDGSGRIVDVIPGSRITLEIAEKGQVTGKAGCNGYFCGIKMLQGKASISPIGATRMYCPEPGIMDQEMNFFSDLESIKGLEYEGRLLNLRGDAEEFLISLEKDNSA
jgi:heat shock protein HslJ